MLQINNQILESEEINTLKSLQTKIDNCTNFEQQTELAQSLWKSKGGVKNEASFAKIREKLCSMTVSVNTCNYCEGNEAGDIEHIYPKSFFPEKTFVWTNYLLACKQCNSGYKLDKCFVIDKTGKLFETQRGEEPTHKTVAFINPRTEDPNEFLWLNTAIWKFELCENLSEADKHKAEKTLEILELNERDYLISGRENAYDLYLTKFRDLVAIQKSATIDQIKSHLKSKEIKRFDFAKPLSEIKNDIKQSTKLHIQTKIPHPSVWHAIKTIESKTNPKWKTLFDSLPEALTW